MNLLISSVGRRCEIVEYFRRELNPESLKVIAVDITEFAPALYRADKHYVLEKDFNAPEKYVSNLIELCLRENVSYVITLIDPELRLFASLRREFDANNVKLIMSEEDIIISTYDKFLFYKKFHSHFNLLDTYQTRDDAFEAVKNGRLNFPLIAKPRRGSGSVGITTLHYMNEFKTLKYNKKYHYIFQNKLNCREYGIDVYFDLLSGKLVSCFMKEKILLRAGETDKALSMFDENIFHEIKKLEKHGGFRGPVDIDIFISDHDRAVYINEINPRFGGGYPMGYGCGVNFMKLIHNNMKGIENIPSRHNYKKNVKMMKYNSIIFNGGGEFQP
jgi:carbamoyl-phosphate synthase large subunit